MVLGSSRGGMADNLLGSPASPAASTGLATTEVNPTARPVRAVRLLIAVFSFISGFANHFFVDADDCLRKTIDWQVTRRKFVPEERTCY